MARSLSAQKTGWNVKDNLRVILPRFGALDDIVEHIVRGPYAIRPSGSRRPNGDWLESFLKLRQFRAVGGPLEARALYIVPNMLAPTKTMPLIRQVTWEREADKERCRKRVVAWPRVTVRFYQLRQRDLPQLDEAVRELDRAVANVPAATEGLNLGRLYEPQERPSEKWIRATPPTRPSHLRWLYRSAYLRAELGWTEASVHQPLNDAWERVWNALGGACVPARIMSSCRESYHVRPKAYAELLTRNLR